VRWIAPGTVATLLLCSALAFERTQQDRPSSVTEPLVDSLYHLLTIKEGDDCLLPPAKNLAVEYDVEFPSHPWMHPDLMHLLPLEDDCMYT
jgi:hypothetical protein